MFVMSKATKHRHKLLKIMNKFLGQLDLENDTVVLPEIGDKVLRDGFEFSVIEIQNSDEIGIIAGIELRGRSGDVHVGYYDFKRHKKA